MHSNQIDSSSQAIIGHLLRSPLAAKARAEIAAELQATHQSLVAELETCHRERIQAANKIGDKIKDAEAVVTEAQAALRSAQANAASLHDALATTNWSLEARERRARGALVESADAKIAETIRALDRQFDIVRHGFAMVARLDRQRIEPAEVFETNAEKIAVSLARIRAARAELEALQVSAADPLPVIKRIASECELGSAA